MKMILRQNKTGIKYKKNGGKKWIWDKKRKIETKKMILWKKEFDTKIKDEKRQTYCHFYPIQASFRYRHR